MAQVKNPTLKYIRMGRQLLKIIISKELVGLVGFSPINVKLTQINILRKSYLTKGNVQLHCLYY